MTKQRFGKLEEDGKLTCAPKAVKIGSVTWTCPTEKRYLEAGWKKVVDVMPQPEDGYWFTPSGWEETETEVRRTYEKHEVQPEVQVVKYSKLKLITALKAAGKWAEVKALIESAGLWDEWLVCSYLKSDYEQFETAKQAVADAGIATAEEVEEILSQSVDEEI